MNKYFKHLRLNIGVLSNKFFLWLFLVHVAMSCHAQNEPIPIRQFGSYSGDIKIPALAVMAQHMMMADISMRRQFAEISLMGLLDAYEAELLASTHVTPVTPAKARKLVQWRWETSRMIAYLKTMTAKFLAGAPFALHINHAYRVMIIVDGQPVLVSGPRLDRKKTDLEDLIIDSFCSLNDCSWIIIPEADEVEDKTDKASLQPSLRGTWIFAEGSLPRYKIDDNLLFAFNEISDRQTKAEFCHLMADELFKLSDVLQTAIGNGDTVDWSLLKAFQPQLVSGKNVLLNIGKEYLQLELPLLSKLHAKDWRRVVDWLNQYGSEGDSILLITQADMMLTDTPTE